MFNLSGRVAAISGASSGLGRQMALAFVIALFPTWHLALLLFSSLYLS